MFSAGVHKAPVKSAGRDEQKKRIADMGTFLREQPTVLPDPLSNIFGVYKFHISCNTMYCPLEFHLHTSIET